MTKKKTLTTITLLAIPLAALALTTDPDGFVSDSSIGSSTASLGSISSGYSNSADDSSISVGDGNYSIVIASSFGAYNSSSFQSASIAGHNTSYNNSGSYGILNNSNNNSFVFGRCNTVLNDGLAFGTSNTSNLPNAITLGSHLIGEANSVITGQYNDPLTPGTKTYVVGKGTSSATRANALEVHSDGKILINGPVVLSEVQGDISMGIYGD